MFRVMLPGFDGALDTLLALIERGEQEILALAITEVAFQYLRFLQTQDRAVLQHLADAAPLVARLIQLKSAALLPRPATATATGEPEADPSIALEDLLREYRRFKAAAEEFRGREQGGLRSFPRLASPPPPAPSLDLSNVTLERLLAAVQEALRRRPADFLEEVPRYTMTVRERLAALEAELASSGRLNFSRFIAACRRRIEIIVTLMAVLELIKMGQASAEQPEPFGDILIVAHTAVTTLSD